MKVKMITSTNKAFECLFGVEMELHIGMIATYTFDPTLVDDFDFRHGSGRTSQIKSIEYNEVSRNCYEIAVKTRNSVYTFMQGEPSEEKPYTDEEVLAFQMAMMF